MKKPQEPLVAVGLYSWGRVCQHVKCHPRDPGLPTTVPGVAHGLLGENHLLSIYFVPEILHALPRLTLRTSLKGRILISQMSRLAWDTPPEKHLSGAARTL